MFSCVVMDEVRIQFPFRMNIIDNTTKNVKTFIIFRKQQFTVLDYITVLKKYIVTYSAPGEAFVCGRSRFGRK